MSINITKKIINGAYKIVFKAEEMLQKAINQYGKEFLIGFPDTAYYLPLIYAMTAEKARKLGDLVNIFEYHIKKKLPQKQVSETDNLTIEEALDAGMCTLFAEEIIEVLKYSLPDYQPKPNSDFWIGFISDVIIREQGIKLVDGRMSGFAVIVGAATNIEIAKEIITQLQENNILVFMSGNSNINGKKISIAEQLSTAGFQIGLDVFLVPLGNDISSTVYALNFATRAAMSFGGIQPGKAKDILTYNKERVYAFVLALGEIDEEKFATAAGAINFGFPILADTAIGEIPNILLSPIDAKEIVKKGIEIRGIKVKTKKIDIPVPFGSAFEGERVRKEQTFVEFGGKYSASFEVVLMKSLQEVENGKIELIGPDIDEIKLEPDETPFAMPLGIVVEVAGHKMQKDFEPIIERQIHHYLSFAKGIFHMGQRNQNWIRISKEAFNAGFRLRHFGRILVTKFLEEFPTLVDKVQVTLYTDEQKVRELLPQIIKIYEERDSRLADLTDEAVDIFYSCTLCQSYAPNHVCIITPEKPGLCGAYNWLDGKAAYEINPKGMNQPISKGNCIDPIKGEWEGVNKFVQIASHGVIERVFNYSIMEYPTTSCGCFECIVAILPECNGFMVVNRGYSGMTPCGMTFSTLAGSVGGGAQIPGFLGVCRLYIISKKFLVPEGGLRRIVWMTKDLKEALGDKLKKRCEEIGEPDLINKIADETITTDPQQLLEFLTKVNHPALTLPSLI